MEEEVIQTSSAERSPFGRTTGLSMSRHICAAGAPSTARPTECISWGMGALEAVRRRKARPILVVDDDSAIRDSERQILADNGFRVVEARDAPVQVGMALIAARAQGALVAVVAPMA